MPFCCSSNVILDDLDPRTNKHNETVSESDETIMPTETPDTNMKIRPESTRRELLRITD